MVEGFLESSWTVLLHLLETESKGQWTVCVLETEFRCAKNCGIGTVDSIRLRTIFNEEGLNFGL